MNRIKEVLDEKGIKQVWLADKLNKSYNLVNASVQNRNQPRLDVMFQIAENLGSKGERINFRSYLRRLMCNE